MIDCKASVSAPLHECQIITELPAGGGDKGRLGGSSVGVDNGLPLGAGGDGNGETIPARVGVAKGVLVCLAVGVTDPLGVRVAPGGGVAGPGEAPGGFVIVGAGEGDVL